MENGSEPIADDELLYRRVPVSMNWYDPTLKELDAEAFGPNKKMDTTGISLSRKKHTSIEIASRGRAGKSYYVAVLRAGDLRQRGIEVEPRPKPENPGHSELPQLNAGNRKETATLNHMESLARLVIRVEGPFDTPAAEGT